MTKPGRAVFLSYASQDAEAVKRLCAALRAAGVEVWFDQSELRGGDAWDQKIRRQIKDCFLFIPIISANTQLRNEGYFRREWNLAVTRTLDMAEGTAFVLPVVIDDISDLEALVPEKFREVQWTHLLPGANLDAFVEHVRQLISGEAIKPARSGTTSRNQPYAPPGQARTRSTPQALRRYFPWIAASIALIAIGCIVTAMYWPARRVAAELPAHVAGPTGNAFNPPAHSIAVLPFVNMSGDPKQEYFSDGISEELLDSLSRLNNLKVVARTSSFSYKGQNIDVSTIAHRLNVGSVLEGSVRRGGDTVRISVQLINAVTGFEIWSRSYDRKLSDILRVQSEVATAVAQELKVELSGKDSVQFGLGGTDNAAAHDAFLRGKELLSRSGVEQSESKARAALAEFETAVSLDPGFALAYAKLTSSLEAVSFWEHDRDARQSRRTAALKAAEKAVALAPELGEAHLALAKARFRVLLDLSGASAEFDRALALEPGSVSVQAQYAGFADTLGHFDVAVDAAKRSASLDPQNAVALISLAETLSDARRFDEAAVALANASALVPGSQWVAGARANLLLSSGRSADAVRFCESPDTPFEPWQRSDCLALAYHAAGRQAEAEQELEKFRSIDKDSNAMFTAAVYAYWGNKTEALKWLRKAEEQRDPDLFNIRVGWEFDPIRKDPDFVEFESGLKMPP